MKFRKKIFFIFFYCIGSFSQHMNHRYKYCRPYQTEKEEEIENSNQQNEINNATINE